MRLEVGPDDLSAAFDGYEPAGEVLGEDAMYYRVQLYDTEGYAVNTDAGVLAVLWLPGAGRIAIRNNAGTSWGDCAGGEDIDQAMTDYLTDAAAWGARN